MDRFEEMRNFVRVVDGGSITRAAAMTHTAKSAVSRRLADLETRLGVQLINRTTRRMTLTDAGHRFYAEASRLLGELDAAEAELSAAEAALSGRIRLAAPGTFGRLHLGPAINDFIVEHPHIRFDIDFNDRRIDLVEEGFDLAIRIATIGDSRLVARRLARVTLAVAASPAYWDTHGRPRRPADLERHRALQYAYRASSTWPYRAPGSGASGSVRVPAILEANSGDYLLEAAIAGLGVILQPRFICYRALQDGRLEAVFPRHEWSDVAVYAVYPQTRSLPQRIRAFIDFLVARWGECPYWEAC
ncbi:MAG: LysR family transcriptional regulator [Gammaproteobacteria bacterium]